MEGAEQLEANGQQNVPDIFRGILLKIMTVLNEAKPNFNLKDYLLENFIIDDPIESDYFKILLRQSKKDVDVAPGNITNLVDSSLIEGPEKDTLLLPHNFITKTEELKLEMNKRNVRTIVQHAAEQLNENCSAEKAFKKALLTTENENQLSEVKRILNYGCRAAVLKPLLSSWETTAVSQLQRVFFNFYLANSGIIENIAPALHFWKTLKNSHTL